MIKYFYPHARDERKNCGIKYGITFSVSLASNGKLRFESGRLTMKKVEPLHFNLNAEIIPINPARKEQALSKRQF